MSSADMQDLEQAMAVVCADGTRRGEDGLRRMREVFDGIAREGREAKERLKQSPPDSTPGREAVSRLLLRWTPRLLVVCAAAVLLVLSPHDLWGRRSLDHSVM